MIYRFPQNNFTGGITFPDDVGATFGASSDGIWRWDNTNEWMELVMGSAEYRFRGAYSQAGAASALKLNHMVPGEATLSGVTTPTTSFSTWFWANTTMVSATSVVTDLYYFDLPVPVAGAAGATNVWSLYARGGVKIDGIATIAGATTLAATAINGAITGTGTLTKTLLIPASAFVPTTTTPAAGPYLVEYGTNDVDVPVIRFADAADSYAVAHVTMPDGWNGSTVTARVLWTPTTGGGASATETVEFDIDMRSIGDDDAIDQAWGTAVAATDVVIATTDLHRTAATAAITPSGTPAGGELLVIRVMRDESESTIVGGIDMLGVQIEFTSLVTD